MTATAQADDCSIPPFLDRRAELSTASRLLCNRPVCGGDDPDAVCANQIDAFSTPQSTTPPPVPAPTPQVLTLARRIRALIEKADKAADKAEQLYKSAGIHIKEIKEQRPDDWLTIVRDECDVGRSRAYELMAIADGRTTLEKVRAGTNERKKVHRAKPAESVPERTEPDAQTERDRKEIVALYQKTVEAERERDEALDAFAKNYPGAADPLAEEMPTEQEAEESWQNDLYEQACLLFERMTDETRQKVFAEISKVYGLSAAP